MSIWNDCEKFNAVPFYGFPVKPHFEDGVITFDFPLGYKPNGSQTQEVADKLQKLFKGEILEVTENCVIVKVNEDTLRYVIYQHYLNYADKLR
jgi:hypothetical protein